METVDMEIAELPNVNYTMGEGDHNLKTDEVARATGIESPQMVAGVLSIKRSAPSMTKM